MPLVAYVTWHMALIPLLWLALRGERRAEWWWLAGAFGVSWLADTTALWWANPWLVNAVYPVSQAGIVGAVLLARQEARLFVGLLVVVGILTVLTEGLTGPDILLETVSAGGVVVIVWPRPLGRLRLALLVAFGGGWLAWMGYLLDPGWLWWSVYQLLRAVGYGLFCWASLRPGPVLRLARSGMT